MNTKLPTTPAATPDASDASALAPAALPVIAVIGAGPAGLMAAQVLARAGQAVHVFDAMPSVGRKFLLAGKGGLNLTHSEAADRFAGRYGARRTAIESLLQSFSPDDLRAWAQSLGVETFVGSSGRIFPTDMKSAPLLRAWLQSLRHPSTGAGVRFHMRHRWTGWAGGGSARQADGNHRLCFDTPQGPTEVLASAVVLALGGGSWARLGSNGAWVPLLAQQGVAVAPLLPSNCGFDVEPGWTAFFASRFAGQAFKSVAISFTNTQGVSFSRKGEFVATAGGIEGSLVYAASSLLRDEIIRTGHATLQLDLLPDMSAERVLAEVQHPRGSRSLSSHLKSRLNLDGIKSALLHELLPKEDFLDGPKLAAAIKSLPLRLAAARPLDEAISSAGGVLFEVLTPDLMLEQLPGVFCAGEMLDWEAPTGGYLLQACFASGHRAAQGVLRYQEKS
ncbi:MAG: aminoacetone oxidase family FAD-binding enzyme [Burkholderiales bacterium PBB3]|nr:MAG: aminoacetone oxidase family FAD-binding enzyme [Burkholderiales bacterium PBB3]